MTSNIIPLRKSILYHRKEEEKANREASLFFDIAMTIGVVGFLCVALLFAWGLFFSTGFAQGQAERVCERTTR